MSLVMAQGCRLGRCSKVGSYPGFSGRDANVAAKAALDPSLKFIVQGGTDPRRENPTTLAQKRAITRQRDRYDGTDGRAMIARARRAPEIQSPGAELSRRSVGSAVGQSATI